MPTARRQKPAAVADFTPSELQQPIFDWFAEGDGNLVVEACAGTGKTTTIVRAISLAPEDSILLAAFNKRIQQELSDRIDNPRAIAQTLHSTGYRAILAAGVDSCWRTIGQGFAREDWLAAQVSASLPYGGKRLVGKLVTKARELQPTTATHASLIDLAIDFDLLPLQGTGLTLGMVADATLRALDIAATVPPHESGIDYADMIFLPLRNSWVQPLYDMVVVDEYQDMTPSQLQLAQAVAKPYARIVLVGDQRQAIYGFRGADSANVQALKAKLQAKELPLSKTYRCPKSVVRIAQQYVPHFTVDDSAPEGVVDTLETIDEMLQVAQSGNFILSRKNAPLAKVAMAILRMKDGPRVKIQGRDIGAGLKSLVNTLAKGDAARSVPQFLARVEAWSAKQVSRLVAAKRADKVSHVYDQAETLRVLALSAEGVPGLLARIDYLFTDNPGDAVICSTVHKAKGLEANRVFILESTFGSDTQEELNLRYVSVTRAKQHLTFVTQAL